ncbi:MAG: succinyl-diaminopimelate desuccinylase [Alphaproteobacteria bacterium]
MTKLCPVEITQELVRIESITPNSSVCLDVVEKYMNDMGAKVFRQTFSGDGSYDVDNLYARIGSGQPHIMLTGHVDVVPIGDKESWTQKPWGAEIVDGKLYGRGSADMKSGVACAITAMNEIANNPNFTGSVSILITGDEESDAINGSEKILKYAYEQGERWDCALTLEPTNLTTMGDQIKVGRRGSLTATVVANGKQGHVGYPEKVDNAIHRLNELMTALLGMQMDEGNEYFVPSSLQIVEVSAGTGATNVAPGVAEFTFNIRFSSEYTGENLESQIRQSFDKTGVDYDMIIKSIHRSFVTNPNENPLADELCEVVEKITGKKPEYVTNGGTSDSRFVIEYCPVVDYGVNGTTIHQVDEFVPVKDIEQLNQILIEYLQKKVC